MPGADNRARLQAAALELFAAEGFADVTASAIAERAGLTERTFFRHFPDKREALFGGEDALREELMAAAAASAAHTAIGAALDGVRAVAARLQPRHAELRRRGAIVARHPELQERERTKLASWSQGLASALCSRGESAVTAALTADVAVAVLDNAAQRWLAARRNGDLDALVLAAFAELRALTRPAARPAARRGRQPG